MAKPNRNSKEFIASSKPKNQNSKHGSKKQFKTEKTSQKTSESLALDSLKLANIRLKMSDKFLNCLKRFQPIKKDCYV